MLFSHIFNELFSLSQVSFEFSTIWFISLSSLPSYSVSCHLTGTSHKHTFQCVSQLLKCRITECFFFLVQASFPWSRLHIVYVAGIAPSIAKALNKA